MPSLDLFLPALLGGFVFVTRFYALRAWTARAEGYKLVFAASIAGGVLWFLAHLALGDPIGSSIGEAVSARWYAVVRVQDSLPAAMAFLGGATIWAPLNLLARVPIWSSARVLEGLVRDCADPLERLFFDSLTRHEIVAVTLKSQKVYVGTVASAPNPAHELESVRLSLVRSGYRDPTTHALHLTVDYRAGQHAVQRDRLRAHVEAFVESILERNPSMAPAEVFEAAYKMMDPIDLQPFEVVILVREIQQVAPFDLNLSEHHFEPQPDEPPTPATGTERA